MIVSLDIGAFRAINNVAGHYPLLDAFGIFCAEYLIVAMYAYEFGSALLGHFGAIKKIVSNEEVRDAAVAAVSAWIGDQLVSLWHFRARPFIMLSHTEELVSPPLLSKSFPSDHAALSFALAFAVLLHRPKVGLALLLAALLVAIGRVYVGVHYPLDIFAGAVAGSFWALLVHILFRCKRKRPSPTV